MKAFFKLFFAFLFSPGLCASARALLCRTSLRISLCSWILLRICMGMVCGRCANEDGSFDSPDERKRGNSLRTRQKERRKKNCYFNELMSNASKVISPKWVITLFFCSKYCHCLSPLSLTVTFLSLNSSLFSFFLARRKEGRKEETELANDKRDATAKTEFKAVRSGVTRKMKKLVITTYRFPIAPRKYIEPVYVRIHAIQEVLLSFFLSCLVVYLLDRRTYKFSPMRNSRNDAILFMCAFVHIFEVLRTSSTQTTTCRRRRRRRRRRRCTCKIIAVCSVQQVRRKFYATFVSDFISFRREIQGMSLHM